MRYVLRFWLALALGLALMAGCSEENDEGGSGGTAGTGGMAGMGGSNLCEGFACDDQEMCTADTCDPVDGTCSHAGIPDGTMCGLFGTCMDGSCIGRACETPSDCSDVEPYCTIDVCDAGVCRYTPVAFGTPCPTGYGRGVCVDGDCRGLECEVDLDCSDHRDCTTEMCVAPGICTNPGAAENGTPCAGGTCQDGECALEGSVLPCTEQGIRNAIAAGGGPYTFDCDGPTTFVTKDEIVIDNDVILDGEGNLTVDGNEDHEVFRIADGANAELRGFTVTGGGGNGGAFNNAGTLVVTDCTVFGNRSLGAVFNTGEMTITNSTLSDNAAAVDCGAIALCGGSLRIISSTVSESFSGTLGNICNGLPGGCSVGDLSFMNTVVAAECGDLLGPYNSSGHNIESPGNTCGFDQDTDQVEVTAGQLNLGPLQDNGGPTMTHALGAGSVAIDQIPEAECLDADGAPLTTDQRSVTRPQGGACDVGAFELEAAP